MEEKQEKERKKEFKELEDRLRNEFRIEMAKLWERIEKDTITINNNFDEVYTRLGKLDGLPPGSTF